MLAILLLNSITLISGGMWHKKEKREVSLEEFVEAAGKHFISNIGA
jgi:hypothetical protein